MIKRLARIAAVVAGLAFVLVSVALVVSYVSPRTIMWGPRGLYLNRGKFHAGACERFEPSHATGSSSGAFIVLPDADKPIWPIAVAIGASLAVLIHLGRRRVPAIGHCSRCSYNLTGNISGICPECGEKASPQQSA